MKKKTTTSLIDGQFCVSDAREILMSLYTSKIHFHEMKAFSSRERFGIEDAHSVKRIPELIETKVILSGLLEEARNPAAQVRITCSVHIELIPEVAKESSQERSSQSMS